MKIEQVETILADNWLYFLVTTDTGIVGLGEAGLWAFPLGAQGIVAYLRPYLVGQDPLRPEHHWQYAYRSSHFRGAALQGALAAIDVALWDIAGKHYGVPIHRLLGGPTRDRVRLYQHVHGPTPQAMAEAAAHAVADGFTAVRLNPFNAMSWDLRRDAVVSGVAEYVGAVREAVGRDVDISVELRFRFTPAEALEIGRALAPFRILFLEDPIPPESPRLLGELAQRMPVPIGTGERLQSLDEFLDLLASGPVAYVRPDLCLTGLTQGKKIAALAEAWHVGVIPHNWLSPVSTAACIQLGASIPNLTVQEYTGGEDVPPKSRLVRAPLRREGGYIVVPETPGLGVELDLEVVRAMPHRPKAVESPTREDGSVVYA